jgi:hypothetical protein
MADASIAANRMIAADFIVSSRERAFRSAKSKVSFEVAARVKLSGRAKQAGFDMVDR